LNSGGVWSVGQNYSTDNTWSWDTSSVAAGNYRVLVHVRNLGSTASYEAYRVIDYVVSSS
jgi:hypothetical protein